MIPIILFTVSAQRGFIRDHDSPFRLDIISDLELELQPYTKLPGKQNAHCDQATEGAGIA